VWLRTLRLEDFRVFPSLELELGPGLNFLYGPNGSGKTSILEAVSWLAVSRSLRGASEGEVVRWGARRFGVGGECTDGARRVSIVLRYERGGTREVTVDGSPLARLSDLLGVLRVAWFGPEDTAITKGGPAERRRLMDLALCQTDPGYLRALTDYRRALRQRNEALLAWGADEEAEALIEVWTEQLVKSGGRVVASRVRFLPAFRERVAAAHRAVAPADSIALSYRSSIAPPAGSGERNDGSESGAWGADDADAAACFRRALARVGDDEKRRGLTLVGPHRDDLEVLLNDRPLRSFGSQGQHRTAAVALKLGEAAVLAADGHGVTVLLDDVLSELDDSRSAALVDLVGGIGQALLTSTRRLPRAPGVECETLRVEGGEVVRA
jgi:DNA replication and repair protein RecF